jgi:cytochrome oxidase Cu insertion factor (SCO1/SenC/PrrC family)
MFDTWKGLRENQTEAKRKKTNRQKTHHSNFNAKDTNSEKTIKSNLKSNPIILFPRQLLAIKGENHD